MIIHQAPEKASDREDSPGADEPVSPPVPDESIVEESTVTPLKRHTVEVYFPSVRGNGLIGEYREIFETVTPGDRAKQIVADLIAGPSIPHSPSPKSYYTLTKLETAC